MEIVFNKKSIKKSLEMSFSALWKWVIQVTVNRAMTNFKKYTLSLLFVFGLYPSISSGLATGVCLHPLEEAALFYGNQQSGSLSSQKKKITKRIEKLEEKLEDDYHDSISDLIDDLSGSLDKTKAEKFTNDLQTPGTTDNVAELISDYIQSKQDALQNPEKSFPYWGDKSYKRYFKSNGKVKDKEFCLEFAKDKTGCKKAIKKLTKNWNQVTRIEDTISKLKDRLDELEDKEFEREFGDEDDTEASALCFTCLDEIRALNEPTTEQTMGNVLSLVAGAGISYFGYKTGRSSARNINNLRIQQGYDPLSTAGPAWAGASLGLPFISNGIYGLANGNSQFGNYACSPGAFSGAGARGGFHGGGPYGGGYGGAGLNFHGGGPYGGGPYGGAGLYFHGGGPYGGGPYGGAGLNFHGGGPYGGGPYGGAGLYFHGGGPYGGGPYGGAGLNFHGGGPYGGGPYGGAGLNFHGGGPYGGGPYGGAGLNFHGGGPYGGGPYGGAGLNFHGGGPYGGAGGLQSQQYAQYMQFQQQQVQAQLKAQQAWIQHQQAVQQDQIQRQQVISSLNQDIIQIKHQIQMIAYGGLDAGALGVNKGSLTAGYQIGRTSTASPQAPQAPALAPQRSSGNSNLPVITR